MLFFFEQAYLFTVAMTAAICAAMGDMYLKICADSSRNVAEAYYQPLMSYRMGVWLVENTLLIYAFQRGSSYILVSSCQVFCYFITSILIGMTVFNERVVSLKLLALGLILSGVILYAFTEWSSESTPASSLVPSYVLGYSR